MRPARRFGTLAVLWAGVALGSAPVAEAQLPGRKVFTRAELDTRGVHRLSELMEWIHGWSSTVEGLSWVVSLDGLPTGALHDVGLPDLELLIDGQPIDLTVLGAWLPESAPIAVQQIDSVVVTRAPGLAGGFFAPRGTVQLFTQRPRKGISLYGWIRTGSETGDPGPYHLTPLATPNVDRIGADRVVLARYGGGSWEAEAGFRGVEQSVTDVRLIERYDTKNLQSYTRVSGPSFRVRTEALGGSHTVLWGHTTHQGFAFLPSRERLERIQFDVTHVGASGSFGSSPERGIAYRLSRSSRAFGIDSISAGEAHERLFTRASVELALPLSGLATRFGVGLSGHEVTREQPGTSRRRTHATVFGEASRETAATRGSLALALVRGEDEFAAKMSAAAEWSPRPTSTFATTLSAFQQLPGEGSAWMDAWVLGGRGPESIPKRTLLWGEIALRQELARTLALELASVYGHVESDALHRTGPDPGAEIQGGRLGFRAKASANPTPRLRGEIAYRSIAPLLASRSIHEDMGSIPDHAVDGSLFYAPAENFRISLLVNLQSATSWWGLDLDAGGEVPPVRRVDVAAVKWFWRRRVQAQMTVRNVFNAAERYHPLGAQFDRRFIFGGSVGFPHP